VSGDGHGLTGDRARALRSPFPGLRAFGDSDDDAELFAGRGAESDLVVANLRAARLTILYGPSGVGKSSLLHAGVLRRVQALAKELREVGAPAPTVVLQDEWAGDPGAALAQRIGGEAQTDLQDAVEAWSRNGNGRLLVVLDQFEEYLRLHPDGEGDAFDVAFPAIACRPDLPVHFLLSLRDDTLAELDRYDGRIPHLFDNYVRLPELTPEAARRAITEPVQRISEWRAAEGLPRVGIEDGLVDDVLEQLTDRARWARERVAGGASNRRRRDALPIEPAFLQLVMRRLWEVEVGGAAAAAVLRRTTLADLGGATAIVRGHLDAAMATLTNAQQDTAAGVFDFLVTPSGAKVRHTAEDLERYARRPAGEIEAVLAHLSAPQLRIIRSVPSPTGDPTHGGYEIFHDVLAEAIRDWSIRHGAVRLERRTRPLALALAGIVAMAGALSAYAVDGGPLHRLDLHTVDARFGLRSDRQPDPKLLLVLTDDATLRAIGKPPRPDSKGLIVPRALQAKVLETVTAGDPATIVEDVEYQGNDDRAGTEALERAIGDSTVPVVLGTTLLDASGNTTLFGHPVPDDKHPDEMAGYAGLPADADHVIRRFRYAAHLPDADGELSAMPVLAVVTAGGHVDPDAFPSRGAWIDYHGGARTYPSVSLREVLDGRVDPSRFAGKIVLIGATAKGLEPAHPTAADGGSDMSGPEVQANAIATARAGVPLRDASSLVVVALIVALALVPPALALLWSARIAFAGAAAAAVVVLVAAQLAFDRGWVVSVVYPLLALVLSAVAVPILDRLHRMAFSAGPRGPASPAAPSRTMWPRWRRRP
jgi:CHASE2 domain-containing sensor protein